MKLLTKVCGFYKIEAVKKNGQRRLLADWFPNLITNSGLDRCANNSFLNRCVVGSGTAAPSVADVELGNQVAANSSIHSLTKDVNNTSPYYVWWQFIFRFNEGVAAGNLSEVGVGTISGSTLNLFSRSLILDTYGDPTTITVLSDEYLDVTYEYRYYPYEGDVTGSIIFTGNIGGTYGYVLRQASILSIVEPSGCVGGSPPQCMFPPGMGNKRAQYYPGDNIINGYSGGIGDIFNRPSGLIEALAYNQMGNETYVPGSFTRHCWIQANPTNWNHTDGLKSVAFTWGPRHYQIEFTPAIPKTEDDVVRLNFSQTWARM